MEQKYTAAQWAQIEGGHVMEDTNQYKFGFIRDLNESKMFRTRQQYETSNREDMANFAFMNLMTLHILSSMDVTAEIANDYAGQTAKYRNFNNYKQSGTDLYVAIAGLKEAGYNINNNKMIQYLTATANGSNYPNVNAFFLQLENQLKITDSNYKAVRRIAANINDASPQQRKLAVTRLLQFYRTKAIRSELYPALKELAKIGGLEISGASVAEKKPSVAAKAAVGAAAFAGGFALGRAFGRGIAGG